MCSCRYNKAAGRGERFATFRPSRRRADAPATRLGGLDLPARAGFTLVELLVVVAIIGILVSLLLPAVQSAREAARRASCSNNLVQMVMAVHQYEATHRVFPPGTVNDTRPIQNRLNGYHHGWLEQILPFIESEALYYHVDRRVSVYDRANRPVRQTGRTWFLCDSNPQNGRLYTHYAGLHHDLEATIDVDQNGIFFLNSAVTSDDVLDGLGYTIFLGEKIVEPGDLGWLSGTRSILRNTGEQMNSAAEAIQRAGTWRSVPEYPPGLSVDSDPMYSNGVSLGGMGGSEDVGFDEAMGMYGDGIIFDGSEILASQEPRVVATFVGGFASFHPGGANFALGDGSVRLLAETISMTVYRQLGHRGDGELTTLP